MIASACCTFSRACYPGCGEISEHAAPPSAGAAFARSGRSRFSVALKRRLNRGGRPVKRGQLFLVDLDPGVFVIRGPRAVSRKTAAGAQQFLAKTFLRHEVLRFG